MAAKYLAVWLSLAIVAVVNGTVRQFTYGKFVQELAAHQISTITAILASSAIVWTANRWWPIRSVSQAWSIGVSWLMLTLIFEFGFGHYIAGHTWDRLLADYNLLEGRVWSLFLMWVAVLPIVIFKFTSRAA